MSLATYASPAPALRSVNVLAHLIRQGDMVALTESLERVTQVKMSCGYVHITTTAGRTTTVRIGDLVTRYF